MLRFRQSMPLAVGRRRRGDRSLAIALAYWQAAGTRNLRAVAARIVVGGTVLPPVPLEFTRLDGDDALRRSHEFLDLMRAGGRCATSRASRSPWELVENALRTAGTAPSGANQQPWTFVVVSDPGREGAHPGGRRARGAAALRRGARSQEYLEAIEPIGTDWTKPHLTDAPYVIVVFEQAHGWNDDGSKRKHYYVRESVGIAVGFLLAALHAAGLATLTHAPSPMGFLARSSSGPENERPFMLIPVGYPADDAVVPDLEKQALDEIVVRL